MMPVDPDCQGSEASAIPRQGRTADVAISTKAKPALKP